MTSPAPLTDFDPETDEVPPSTVIGVEQEYKWRLGAQGLFDGRKPELDELAAAVPAPERSVPEMRFRHVQSTIYFDDRWQLTERQVALRATVNPGTIKRVAWLGVKQTIRWEAGCRDSLELGSRLAARDIGREVRDEQSLAPAYARRLVGAPITPRAYASVVQHRHKIFYRDSDNVLLQVTYDVSEFKALPDGATRLTYWLEIENNVREPRARQALDRWAAVVSQRLGVAPGNQAKSEIAAEMAGWTRES